jgi:hypothetical protein
LRRKKLITAWHEADYDDDGGGGGDDDDDGVIIYSLVSFFLGQTVPPQHFVLDLQRCVLFCFVRGTMFHNRKKRQL